jgi:dipeptidyl aminopeptidase/acylaminoacyl peptidase
LTQFYSFRWNFQLMAANGYIVVCFNRHKECPDMGRME